MAMSRSQALTQEQLHKELFYDPETGLFRWIRKGKRYGLIAGHLSKFHGYVQICVRRELLYAHRLAFLYMTGSWPESVIDHINHIRNDNRWVNLRDVSLAENALNRSLSTRNTSGVTGVSFCNTSRKWLVYANANGAQQWLGAFEIFNDAVKRRKEFEKENGYSENHGKTFADLIGAGMKLDMFDIKRDSRDDLDRDLDLMRAMLG